MDDVTRPPEAMPRPQPHSVVVQAGGRWWLYRDPLQVLVADRMDAVLPVLATVDTAVNTQGVHAAGFIAYEAAAALGLATQPGLDSLPLVWFGLYAAPQPVDVPRATGDYAFHDWQPALDRDTYTAAIHHIKAAIARGDTYQVNYTFPVHARFEGDPWALFAGLVQAQQAQHTAYVDTGRFVICSASPELFFELDGDRITSRPMKGTAVRGRTLAEDRAQISWLQQSEKNRAENVMIVDMIRNDIGRVARIGSVAVPRLFDVERYPTVLQMTSTVTGRSTAPLRDILAAMFPCASITGAPKVRTMQIIRELEPRPRGVYTGAIGTIRPGRQVQFNVAIRTVTIDQQAQRAIYNVGSGIVWDSDAAEEYEECRLKSRVLVAHRPQFDLLESLLWTPDAGYFLLGYHLERLADSADYFGIPLADGAALAELERLAQGLDVPCKVRLLVDGHGRVRSQGVSLDSGAMVEPVRVGLAAQPVDPGDVWLFHKTTRRAVYDAARASRPDCDDVLLWNTAGELTEASSSNVVVRLDGALVTPPVASGLLAGTFRRQLLADGVMVERPLPLSDLARAAEIYLINSVRGWRTAVLVAPGTQKICA